MPGDVIILEKFGGQEISCAKKSVKPLVNATSLEAQFNIFRKIVAAKRLKYELNQSSSLAETNKKITDGERETDLLVNVYQLKRLSAIV